MLSLLSVRVHLEDHICTLRPGTPERGLTIDLLNVRVLPAIDELRSLMALDQTRYETNRRSELRHELQAMRDDGADVEAEKGAMP